MIRFLCIDGDRERLDKLARTLKGLYPSAVVETETDGENACCLAQKKEYDAVFTETRWKGGDGLRIARSVHDVSPQTKVVFLTRDASFAVPAFKTRASGYLLAPVSEKELAEELADLNVGEKPHLVEAKTFGNFELLCDGVAVRFSRSKTKEMIAYLVDRRGTAASSSELIVNLWEEKDVDRTTRSMFHNLVSDAKKVFAEYGISDVLDFKHNAFRIDDRKIRCDYYDLLDGKPNASGRFTGDYMAAYPWADMTAGTLSEMTGRY